MLKSRKENLADAVENGPAARTKRALLLLPLFLVLVWIAVILQFSMRSGTKSHDESGTVKNEISSAIKKAGVPVDRKVYKIYQPFMHDGAKVNGEAFLRKSAHAAEYFILGVLCFIAWRALKKRGNRLCPLLLLTGPAVASADEGVIQKFIVAGRTSSFRDVLLDGIGFFAAMLFSFLVTLLFSPSFRRETAAAFRSRRTAG